MRLQLEAGHGLHPFILGMTFKEVMREIQHYESIVPSVRFTYREQNHLEHPLTLNLEQNGLVFYFEPISQRLFQIEINLGSDDLNLFFKRDGREIDFMGPSLPPRLNFLYEVFGATTPGIYDAESQLFKLRYPCMEFHFPIANQYQKYFEKSNLNIRVDYPDGAAPVASKMKFFYSYKLEDEPKLPPLPPVSPSISPSNAVYFEQIGIDFKGTVTLMDRYPTVSLSLGEPLQRVLSIFGDPEATFPRQSGTGVRRSMKKKDGYVLNYFSRGIDILMDGVLHEVDMIRLFTNFPGHPLFNVYQRANFAIADTAVANREEETFTTEEKLSNTPTPPLPKTEPSSSLLFSSTLDDLKVALGEPSEPLVHNPASSANPYGPSHFYVYDKSIFEVIRNGHLASLTLYGGLEE
ncbi:hypothetical protein P9112_011105 [Eukaryota sp. TZLM1-RC]